MNEPITVLLVDDHALVRQGVRAFLQTQPDIEVVGEAASGQEALQQAGESAPDVVLMDLLMPGMDGVETTRRLKAISPRSQVIMLTSYHDDAHVLPALRSGALSYLLKDVGAEELADTIRKAARGDVVLHPRIAAQVIGALHGGTANKSSDPTASEPPLTTREIEVLRLIATGISNAEIAGQLFVSEKTIKSHVSNILGKLHLADRTQAAVYAFRHGIVKP
ncbi:MAG: response regulator transcription factor [Akkermansiaceae bacterium]|nr:response regulator transcription factor [Armatimonadota bacterium]